jgi:hypothetical protein
MGASHTGKMPVLCDSQLPLVTQAGNPVGPGASVSSKRRMRTTTTIPESPTFVVPVLDLRSTRGRTARHAVACNRCCAKTHGRGGKKIAAIHSPSPHCKADLPSAR